MNFELPESVKVKILKQGANLPRYATQGSAGADLFALSDADIIIMPGQTVFIGTGIAISIPQHYVGLICARSGLSCKQGLAPANKVGVIDSDYRGELIVALFNHSDQARTVHNGDRIAQLLIMPIVQCVFLQSDELDDTIRGNGGFGHTDKL